MITYVPKECGIKKEDNGCFTEKKTGTATNPV